MALQRRIITERIQSQLDTLEKRNKQLDQRNQMIQPLTEQLTVDLKQMGKTGAAICKWLTVSVLNWNCGRKCGLKQFSKAQKNDPMIIERRNGAGRLIRHSDWSELFALSLSPLFLFLQAHFELEVQMDRIGDRLDHEVRALASV